MKNLVGLSGLVMNADGNLTEHEFSCDESILLRIGPEWSSWCELHNNCLTAAQVVSL